MKGWNERQICDVCLVTDYVANGSFAALRENVHYLEEDGYAILVRLADSTRGWNGNYKYVSEAAYRFLKKSSLIPGDLVMSNVGEPGKVFVVPDLGKPMTLGPNSVLIRCNVQDCVSQFLFYYFSSNKGRSQIDDISEGVAQKKFNKTAFRALKISVPPIPEQQRIVGILDEAFEGIATAKASAEKNLQNARALFESHLHAVFTHRGPGWVGKSLGTLSKINYGYTESASHEKIGPKFLRITDIQDNRVDWSAVPYCRMDSGDLPKYQLATGDIVFARTGATTGKSYLITAPLPEAVFASYLIRVRLSSAELLAPFLNLFFQTKSYWDSIKSGVSGSAQGGFNASKLGELLIPYPKSIPEQKSIITHLALFAAETRRLEALYARKLAALDELKTSLLHQAFSGQL